MRFHIRSLTGKIPEMIQSIVQHTGYYQDGKHYPYLAIDLDEIGQIVALREMCGHNLIISASNEVDNMPMITIHDDYIE